MATAAERLSVYDDSEHVARGLEESARSASERRYWIPEAAVHIRGLYALASELAAELDALRRQE